MVRLWTWTMARRWRMKNRSENLCRGGPESTGYLLSLDKWGKLTSEFCVWFSINALRRQEKGQTEGAGKWRLRWRGYFSAHNPRDFFTSSWWIFTLSQRLGAARTCISLPAANLSLLKCLHLHLQKEETAGKLLRGLRSPRPALTQRLL